MSEERYKWRKSIILTKKEGRILEDIIASNNCDNISQFMKRIVHNDPINIAVNATPISDISEEQNHIIAEAIARTNSRDIVDLCRKISGGQLAILIK